MPEARIILAHATTYLACAPKSNASYLAIDKAMKETDYALAFAKRVAPEVAKILANLDAYG